MPNGLPRRDLLALAPAGLLGWRRLLVPVPAGGAASARQGEPVGDSFPAHDPAIVREVVSVSHGNLERVRELVEPRPELAKVSWDWGYGDWESALGAASHTGSREIARLLLDSGARPTIFSAAMLGQLEVVRAFIAAAPGIQNLPGPHGIPLVAHARAGGEPAREVHDYLQELGYESRGPERVPIEDEAREMYVGSYVFGGGPTDRLVVSIHERVGLRIERPDVGIPRGLAHLGNHTFHPAGAASVRIRFEYHDGAIRGLMVLDPDVVVRARREGA